nr:hypothetical transcript [Hymenolepis microstoma]
MRFYFYLFATLLVATVQSQLDFLGITSSCLLTPKVVHIVRAFIVNPANLSTNRVWDTRWDICTITSASITSNRQI